MPAVSHFSVSTSRRSYPAAQARAVANQAGTSTHWMSDHDPVHGRVHPAGPRHVAGGDRGRVELARARHPPRLEPAGPATQQADDQALPATTIGRRRAASPRLSHGAAPMHQAVGGRRRRQQEQHGRDQHQRRPTHRASARWTRACRGSRGAQRRPGHPRAPIHSAVLMTAAIIAATPADSARRG